ncbi:hypothetical protein ACWEO2_06810 [Nocardia sp. NPDC004278]
MFAEAVLSAATAGRDPDRFVEAATAATESDELVADSGQRPVWGDQATAAPEVPHRPRTDAARPCEDNTGDKRDEVVAS